MSGEHGQMNLYKDTWDLMPEVCPCDIFFCDWMDKEDLRNKTVFHFGTGSHHIVGERMATNGRGNKVLGITASVGEIDAFVQLAIAKPRVERSYKAFFGDIYQLEPRLLPTFDVVSLFHLCEFYDERNAAYGALNDRQVLDMLTDKTSVGGHILFYTRSQSWEKAAKVVEQWEQAKPVAKAGMYETLLIYRKTA